MNDGLAVIETYFERLASGDHDGLRAMFAPDVEVHVFHLRDGLIAGYRVYNDTTAFAEAFGTLHR